MLDGQGTVACQKAQELHGFVAKPAADRNPDDSTRRRAKCMSCAACGAPHWLRRSPAERRPVTVLEANVACTASWDQRQAVAATTLKAEDYELFSTWSRPAAQMP